MHDYNGNFYGMHFFFWIFLIVIVLVVIFILGKQRKNLKKETPLKILKKRFAKGEITKEEFEKSKEALKTEN